MKNKLKMHSKRRLQLYLTLTEANINLILEIKNKKIQQNKKLNDLSH